MISNKFEYDAALPPPELVEVFPNEEQPEPLPPELPYSFDLEPAIYIEGRPIILRLTLSRSQQSQAAGKELVIELPDGLLPAEEQYLSLLSLEGTLTIPLVNFSGSISLNEMKPLTELGSEIALSASIVESGTILHSKMISIPTQGYNLNSSPTPPQSTSAPVLIQSDDEYVANNLLFYCGSLRSQSIPNHSLSLNPVEILAVDPLTATNIETFEQPLHVSLGYQDSDFTPEEERNLQAFYYSELHQDWFPIQTTTDPELNLVHFQTNHLTVFDVKVSDWQSYIPPITQSYEVSAFTGAMNYSYPLKTFAGPGGLKPELTLSYNSQIIDQSIAYSQASWVGMGWTLETGSITRDMHGTDDTTDDDTFFLSYNGISQRLLPISQANDVIQFRSQENPTEKVTWNTSSNIWKVRSGDGLIYTFGGTNAVAKLKQGSGCALTNGDLNQTWQWGLTSVRDRFGNTITYEYQPEVKGLSDTNTDEDVYCYNHINLTPSKILYGNFEILFVTAPRYDFRSSWQHYEHKVLFTRKRLDHVDIKVNGSIVKSYLFKYATNAETSNVIYPNFIWFNGAKTSTLVSVQEVQTSGANPVEGYKPITFSYAVDHMHLDEINNGYGGKLQFQYAPKYHVDDDNKDIRTARWEFWERPCQGQYPEHDRRGWEGDGYTLVQCINGNNGPSLILWHNQNYNSGAVHVFPEKLLKPGARLIFWQQARKYDNALSPTSDFGFRSALYPDDINLIKK